MADGKFSLPQKIRFTKNITSAALLIIFVGAFLSLIFLHQQHSIYDSSNKTAVLGAVTDAPIHLPVSFGLPVRIKIPKIQIDAAIQHVGVTSEGEMDVPSNSIDVGWFKFGVHPGEKGSAVIAGHYDGKNGKRGVFEKLDKLEPGDKILVEDDKGKSVSFIVRESRNYRAEEDAPDVFGQRGGASQLNLITCDGVWDEAQKSYTKRLVVFADISPPIK